MYLAGRIPGARLVELPGHRFWWKDDLAATIEAYSRSSAQRKKSSTES